MKKTLLFNVLIVVSTMGAMAQNSTSTNESKTTIKELDTIKTNHPIAIQIHGGTQGVGLDLRYGLNDKLSFRIGGSIIPTVKADNVFSIAGFDADNTLRAKVGNVHLLADYHPFKSSVFKIVGGLAYVYEANGGLNFRPKGDYNFDGLSLTAEEVGNLDIDLSWKGIAPYIGIGLFKTFPKKTFNINLDLGTYYLTAPKSTVVGTNLLSDNYKLEPQLNKNMESYRFLPVIQLNFNFKLN